MKHASTPSFEDVIERYAEGLLDAEAASRLLDATLPVDDAPVAHAPPSPATGRAPAATAIAVVGMAGEFPGATDVRRFAANLAAGRSTVGPLPPAYLADAVQPYRWGGVLEERDAFDPAFFGIPGYEAHSMSAHQRLALRETWRALENAGIDPTDLRGEAVGVFVGAEPTGYVHETLSGSSDAVIAGRISYLLDLKGPALVVNTACSSSLVAIHLACESLRAGECTLAIAGGVYADLNQRTLAALGQSGMLSPDGRCSTFDADANGTLFSEGVAMLAFKRLHDARADGDPIHGIVVASGVNHDGASNGLTAPSGEAQERLILSTYERFGIDAARIGYVEAHGTGTRLGDPIEANALARAFARLGGAGARRIGSAKAFIGHTGAAAGAIGMVKALLGMRHGRYFGMPHWRRINPMIDLSGSSCAIDDRAAAWERIDGAPRLCAVTSLGLSGTNGHAVLEEADEPVPAAAAGPRRTIVPLSAENRERLRLAAGALADALAPAHAEAAEAAPTPEEAPEEAHGPATDAAGPRCDLAELGRIAAEILDVDEAAIDTAAPLEALGFEATRMRDLAERLEARLGRGLSIELEPLGASLADIHRRLGTPRVSHASRAGDAVAGGAGATVDVTLAQVARTLQVGRREMPARVAYVVESLDELLEALRADASGEPGRGLRFSGDVAGLPSFDAVLGDSEDVRDLMARWFERDELERLAQLWVMGMPIAWPDTGARRVPLPGHPFSTERWGKHVVAARTRRDEAPGAAHPRDPEPRDPEPRDPNPSDPNPSDTAPSDPAPSGPAPAAPPEIAAIEAADAPPAVPPPVPALPSGEALVGATARWLVSLVSDTIGTPADAVDASATLEGHGVDSIARTRINHILANAFPEASHTLLFEYEILDDLAAFLAATYPGECVAAVVTAGFAEPPPAREPDAARVAEPHRAGAAPRGRDAPAVATRTAPAAEDATRAIAIVGMSARFPGAPDVAAFWDALLAGRTAIGEIPADRWDWRQHYAPDPTPDEWNRKSRSKWGAFLEGHQEFDAGFFGFLPIEARNIDPQERIFLQECWKALEDAGYASAKMPERLRRRAGVFAGASKHGFELAGAEAGLELPRTSFGALVNRVSWALDFGGPSEATNTACSSALVALHRACDALRTGAIDLALVGGVNLYLHPSTYVELTATRMLCERADCAAFGADATGIVPGEGVAAIVLRPLDQALADGDDIYATILGSAVNHNGRTSAFTTPSPERQAEVIRSALETAGVDPRTIGYVESSANGSEIGDAVEMSALAKVFGGRTGAEGAYTVGSVKPNIGHGEAVSGMAQLVKVVEALRRRRMPPTLRPARINPAIDFSRLPFALHDAASDWRAPVVDGVAAPLRAGVTSIGAGGVNAHVVLEEAPRAAPRRPAAGPASGLIVLSARSPEQLRALARRWADFLSVRPELDLARAANTLQVGRVELPHRLAIVAGTPQALRDRLTRFVDTGAGEGVFTGETARPGAIAAPETVADGAEGAAQLARAWVAGARIDWARLAGEGASKLAGLPTYPFERRVCAPERTPSPERPASGGATVREALAGLLARLFDVPPDRLAEASFQDLGLNSVNAVALVDEINKAFGARFPTSLAFEFPDLAALAEHLERRGVRPALAAPATVPAPAPLATRAPAGAPDADAHAVAVVGLSCRTAGARDAGAFWELIRDGRDALEVLTDPDALALYRKERPDGAPPRWGALPDAEMFDAAFFKISPNEAAAMHPAQRVLLEECYRALEHAGQDPAALRGRAVATVVGTNALPPQSAYTAHAMLGSDVSVMAARLAYFLDLKGPALAVDTACSSSLVAVDTAVRLLRDGAVEMALAGGVTVYGHAGIFAAMEALGIVSPTRVCRPFDAAADGMLLGEGVGVVVLKRLADARRDGDRVHAVIRASGTNQDGRTSGLTAPSYLAQADLVHETLVRSGVDPAKLGYVEAHGTGTRLGDPVEVHGLNEALGRLTARRGYCAIGSVKANIGHTTAAAGVLGLIKLVLCMEHGTIPPAANFRDANPHIDFADGAVYVAASGAAWPADEAGRRWGAVSSFGYSGTNAHVVVEGPPAPPPAAAASPRAELAPLSARSEAELREKAGQLAQALRDGALTDADLPDVAFTLQVGREAFAHRLVVEARALDTLSQALARFAAGASDIPGLVHGRAGADASRTAGDGLAARWCAGGTVDWAALHAGRPVRRIPLPTHPFARVALPVPGRPTPAPAAAAAPPSGATSGTGVMALLEHGAAAWWRDRPELVAADTILQSQQLDAVLNGVTRDLMLQVLQQAGLFRDAAERHTLADLARRLNVGEARAQSHARLLAAIADMLVLHGALARDGDTLRAGPLALERAGRTAGLDDELARLAARHPEVATFLPFMKTCIEAVPDLLRGRRQPHEVLFPGGSFEALADIYSGNESANAFIAALVGVLVRAHGRGASRPFRALEIGAGTGSASRHVLPELARASVPVGYVYTDISRSFTQFGARQFAADYPFVEFVPLDVENPPRDQGFEEETYDLVIASNVLHATTDIRRTMDHARRLLRPGGVVIMLEATRIRDYFTLTFGLTSGWWAYTDERLPHSPLLSIPLWRAALARSGFDPVRAWPLLGGSEADSPEAVIVALRPEEPVAAPAGPSAPATRPEPAPVARPAEIATTAEPQPLPASPPTAAGPSSAAGAEPWASGFERLVADAWRDVLGQHTIGPRDDFRDLGGDSILALQISSRLKQAIPIPLELPDLFEARSVAEMARMLEAEVVERIDELPEETLTTLLAETV